MSISPAHIVNYKYITDNTSNPLMNEEQCKILAISQARLIYILYNHISNSPDYKSNLITRENILKDNCGFNSVILVEEDSEIKKGNLRCNWFLTLKPAEHRIKGWDDHEACKGYEDLYARQDALNLAIQKVTVCRQNDSQIESWNTLKAISTSLKKPYLCEDEINSFIDKKLSSEDMKNFDRKKAMFFMQCKIEMEQSKINYVYDTFQIRQNSLDQKIEKNLNKGRTVFVLCGKNHGNPTDKKLIPIVNDHLSKKKVPFIVVDPSQPTPKTQSKSV